MQTPSSNDTREDFTHEHHQIVNTEIRLIIYSLQPKTEKLHTVSKNWPGADCGSDHEFLIAKFRLKLKKVGKTIWPFRYDLNQIPYDYTVEVRNRFKGLDLIECLMNYGWRFGTLYRRRDPPSPRKKNAKKENGCLRRPYKWLWKEEKPKAKEKRKATHLNAEFQRIARRDKKAFLNDQYKEIEENNRMGKTRDLFKNIRDTKGTFQAKMGSIKDRNGMDLTEAEDIKKRW